MDDQRFSEARAVIVHFIEDNQQDLSLHASDLRFDGLPQNWVDDLPNLTLGQRVILSGDIPETAPAWAQALKELLGA